MIQCGVQMPLHLWHQKQQQKQPNSQKRKYIFPHPPENRILMVLYLKKIKWRTQESTFESYYFQCLRFERDCTSKLRISMTSESQNKSRSQITVLIPTLVLNLHWLPPFSQQHVVQSPYFTMQIFLKDFSCLKTTFLHEYNFYIFLNSLFIIYYMLTNKT